MPESVPVRCAGADFIRDAVSCPGRDDLRHGRVPAGVDRRGGHGPCGDRRRICRAGVHEAKPGAAAAHRAVLCRDRAARRIPAFAGRLVRDPAAGVSAGHAPSERQEGDRKIKKSGNRKTPGSYADSDVFCVGEAIPLWIRGINRDFALNRLDILVISAKSTL